MRILAVANWDPDQQKIPWAEQRITSLRRAGVEVELLAEPCAPNLRAYLRLRRHIDERLRSRHYDLVAPLYGSVLGLVCALQRRVPCAVSFAGSDLNGSPTRPLSVPVSQLAAALATGVSVRSRAMRRALWWPASRHTAWVIPSGVDTQRFRPLDRHEARLRRGLPVGGWRAVVVPGPGHRPEKRVDLAREAIGRLRGVTLEVVTDVPFDQMPLVYPSADVLVLTSLREGSPNCVKEALACAVPVVSVDVGDVGDVIMGLTNCSLTAADPAALARAVAATLADGRGCPEGPARMQRHHSLDAMTEAFLRFYRSVVDWPEPAAHSAAAIESTSASASRSVGSASS